MRLNFVIEQDLLDRFDRFRMLRMMRSRSAAIRGAMEFYIQHYDRVQEEAEAPSSTSAPPTDAGVAPERDPAKG